MSFRGMTNCRRTRWAEGIGAHLHSVLLHEKAAVGNPTRRNVPSHRSHLLQFQVTGGQRTL